MVTIVMLLMIACLIKLVDDIAEAMNMGSRCCW